MDLVCACHVYKDMALVDALNMALVDALMCLNNVVNLNLFPELPLTNSMLMTRFSSLDTWKIGTPISTVMQAKNKPTYTPYAEDGEMCTVLNAKDVWESQGVAVDSNSRSHSKKLKKMSA
ncbi:hypothetical protein AAC387_Pa01g1849 [Persea americana]